MFTSAMEYLTIVRELPALAFPDAVESLLRGPTLHAAKHSAV